MRVFRQRVTLLLVSGAVVAMIAMGGCAKKEAASPPAGTAPAAAPPSPMAANTPAASAKDVWTQIADKRKALKSYRMVMDMGGHPVTMSMEMANGKPVRARSDMGPQGWALVQFDNKVQYVYNPQMKAALKSPLSGQDQEMVQMDQDLKDTSAKISTDTIDGEPCWKIETGRGVIWADKKYGLPRQMEVGGESPRSGTKRSTRFRKVNSSFRPEPRFRTWAR